MSHENAINQINVQQRWLDMVKTIDFKYMTKNLKKLLEEIIKKIFFGLFFFFRKFSQTLILIKRY